MRDDRLWQILQAPQTPTDAPSEEDWLAVETKFGALPEDFKMFVSHYGSGSIGGFIWLFSPASRNENLEMVKQAQKQLQALDHSRPSGLALFPEHGGILPFGITDNGDLLAWRVRGKPDEWGVVVVDSRAPKYEEFKMSFSRFLTSVLTKELVCTIFPDDVPGPGPAFMSVQGGISGSEYRH